MQIKKQKAINRRSSPVVETAQELWRGVLYLALGVFLFSPLLLRAAGLAVFAFTSPAQFSVGELGAVTVQSQNVSGASEKVLQTMCLSFRTDSQTGAFLENQAADETHSVLVVTMGKNTANRSVYYRDTAPRSATLSLHAAPRPEAEGRSCKEWPENEWGEGRRVEQAITVGAGIISEAPAAAASTSGGTVSPAAPATLSSPSQTGSASAVGGAYTPLEPQVFVSAQIPPTVVVGADAFFEAEAFGKKKEPLQNTRFVWSFGDGTVKEGKSVSYTYHYPGEYVVVVEAASGVSSGAARGEVAVIPAALSIRTVVSGDAGLIEIENSGSYEVNLSRWRLRSGGAEFYIPEHTIILAKRTLPFSSAVTKLTVSAVGTALLYPNGSVALTYVPLASPSVPPPPSGAPSVAPYPQKVSPPSARVSAPEPLEDTVADISGEDTVSSSEAALDLASRSELLLAAAGTGVRGNDIGKWVAAVVLLLIAAVFGYGFFLRTPAHEMTPVERLKQEAEEYELME